MRRHAAVFLLAVIALLLTPGAAGLPNVPGDPTPPVVVPVITGTLGLNGWYTTNVTVNWSVTDPESIILSTTGCNAVTFTSNTTGTTLTCTAESDGGTSSVGKTFRVDKTGPATTATPSRAADSNGWYNHDLSVDFNGSDTTSGLESCSPDATYGGPDTSATTVAGTCRDVAGNTAPATLPLKYDETAPQSSPAARPPDANGWHNHAVTVTFQGIDGTSGVATCTQTTYSGPDDPSVALTGSCVDQAGNQSPSALFTTKYDETPPQATATASRPADVNGWHNHALTVSYAGSDATSGLASCDPTESYAGPDSASATISGACRDLAGNVAPRSVVVKYDATAPQVTTTPARAANAAGWYNAPLAVTFAGTDPVSGLASCVQPQTYSGPDNAAASVPGSCSDQAGNVRNASFGLKYDSTAPQTTATPARAAGPTGWYVAPLSVSFAATDPTSGVANCDAAKTYAGPDASAATVSGSCRDNAGNSDAGSLPLKYDATAPQVTAAPSRPANGAGWYTAPLSVSYSGGDATSGLASCDPVESFSGPDSASAAVSGACRDQAGNTGSTSFALKYDATAPPTTATPSRAPNGNGWFNAPLTVSFAATDATSGTDSCDTAKSYSGPDIAATTIAGACRDRAGNAGAASYGVKYDGTPPAATATASRLPNANGWFNAPLNVAFAATDAMSGLDSCPALRTYSGPDDATATVSGTCLDKAGNADVASIGLKYDATAPATAAAPSRQPNGNGWYNAPLTVGFTATDATSTVDSCDAAKGYNGPDAGAASLAGNCRDKAGNTGTATFGLKYDATAPVTSATPSRQPNGNGWFNAALAVGFTATDATSTVESCDAAKTYAGPDTASASVAGACRDKAGNTGSASLGLKYDATAPVTSATPARQPNGNGWYNAALAVSFSATDATSTVESCQAPKTYSGPDNDAASVTGSCVDKAGNLGASSLALKYDATAPVTSATPSRQPNGNGWFNAPLSVSFTATDATSTVDSCDAAKGYSGPDSSTAAVGGSCRDKAGNAASASLPVKYDATSPVTTATASRQPNGAGWYNAPLTVSFTATDATSTVDSCDAAKTYSAPDTASGSVAGICRDKAGNAASAALALKYDATAPVATATASRQPNANGWYRAPLDVSFAGTDAMSEPVTCPTQKSYQGPDSGSAVVSGTCTDKAGNSRDASLTLKYDATGPSTTITPSRPPNATGWFNASLTVGFAWTDPLSGLEACPAEKSYSGPDAVSAVVSGTCLDKAGNGTLASYPLKYDATAPLATATPARQPNANGWYKASLAVGFSGTDATSGIGSCDPAKTYSTPDSTNAVLSGECIDRAGNRSPAASYAFKYDATAPTVGTPVPTRLEDRAGWYNRPVGFAVDGQDTMSGIASCPPQSYTGPDSATASFAGTCFDRAGNSGTRSFALKYDATGPATTATADRSPDSSGWFNHPLTVSFSGTDAVSGTDSCSAAENYAGPDSVEAVVGGVCVDKAGNVGLASLSVSYDATAPVVAGAEPARLPDANGWYNHTVVVGFRGSDATSGIASCTQATYAGPDSSDASVSGSCHDHAGNGGGSLPFGLRFDSTAPAIGGLRVKPGNGSAVLSWTASPDTTLVEIHRGAKRVYSGTGTTFTDKGLSNGVRYRYTLKSYDEAANSSTEDVAATPSGPLVSPAAGAVVNAPPRLAWKAVPKATYYHVQLWRQGRILSAWPRGTSFQLRRSWVYNGRRYRLAPGRYRWYVWSGRGRPAQKNFGPLIGSSSFRVR